MLCKSCRRKRTHRFAPSGNHRRVKTGKLITVSLMEICRNLGVVHLSSDYSEAAIHEGDLLEVRPGVFQIDQGLAEFTGLECGTT